MICNFHRLKVAFARYLIICAFVLIAGCSSVIPNQNPTAQRFPSVSGESLEKVTRTIPDDLKGAPAVLLIGFIRKAQFDLDRWILGIKQLETPVKLLEMPTIEGMMPGLAAGFITDGMRKGIPSEEWPDVVTIFSDASKITSLFGTENPNNGRIVLIDKDGNIQWFYDRGYSAKEVLTLDKRVRELKR